MQWCGYAWGSCRQAIVIIIMREVGMHKWWVLIVKHARRSILAVALNKVVISVVVHLNWEMDCFFFCLLLKLLTQFLWNLIGMLIVMQTAGALS